VKQREFEDCMCGGPLVAIPGPENEAHFEAEINRLCPVHGLRRFESFHSVGTLAVEIIIGLGKVNPPACAQELVGLLDKKSPKNHSDPKSLQ
jgi:hypothetical protein